ncbi:MAG: epoxyqueuosine reductase QueH [Bacteroidetes bacterium]|nr:epoxyqueuosine reductase QueH [Bacteroidota bacterium]
MEVLLHVCCGPCTIYPLAQLRQNGHTVTGYFFNPNIHPFQEFKKRVTSLVQLSDISNLPITLIKNYGLNDFLQKVVFHENKRCNICYDMRLEKTAEYARHHGFEAFTTTLLYSRYQNHVLIKEKCEKLAQTFGISFIYNDYRKGWQEGIDSSISLGLYRQPYCGCIYSEQERYDKRFKKTASTKDTF